MATNATWAITLLDRVTAPGGRIDRMLSRLETRIVSTTATTRGLSTAFNSAAIAGENSARRISSAWNGVHRSMTNSRSAMQGMVSQMAGLTALAAGVGYAGKTVLDAAGLREMQITQISTLLKEKDPSKVKASVDWINRFADTTPFTDSQTMGLVRRTMGYGFNYSQMQGIVRIVGDAANLSADDPADASFRAGAVIRALGQIKSKGKLMQQEVNQIAEHIPGVTTALDRAFGGGANRMKLQMKGQISSGKALSVILQAMDQSYGGGMEIQAQQLLGLASTLKSRPQRVMGMLTDLGGLEQPKRFFRNLVNLTDSSRDPGKRLLNNLATTGKRAVDAIFGPLADATEGGRAEQLVTRITEKLEQVTDWWTRNGPRIAAEARGFGDGLKMAGDGAMTLLRPLIWVSEKIDKLSGGSGEGMLGKILGFAAGGVILGRLANFLSFGMLGRVFGTVGARAGTALMGGIARAWRSSTWMGPMLMRSVRAVGWLRALGLDSLGTTLARVLGPAALRLGGVFAGLSNPIGWVVTAVTTIYTLGDQLYKRFTPFADLWDRVKASVLGITNSRLFRGTGTNALDDNTQFLVGVNQMARRLGVQGGDLMRIMNFESGLDPSKRNSVSGATGLIQFMPGTARELGTTTDALSRMTRAQQLPYIEEYLKRHGVTAGMGLEQLYMSILTGSAGNTGALWRRGSVEYKQNSGLDTDKDGIITSAEAVAKVQAAWTRDRASINQTLAINVNGSVDPAAVQAIQQATQQGALNALGTIGLEGGY